MAPHFVGETLNDIMLGPFFRNVSLHVQSLLVRSKTSSPDLFHQQTERLGQPIGSGAKVCSACVRGDGDLSSCGLLLASDPSNLMCYGCPGFNNSDIKKRTFRRVTKNGRVEFSVPVYTKDGKVYCDKHWHYFGRSFFKKDGIQQRQIGWYCQHACARSTCKECRGSQICEHDRRRYQCKECDGVSICEHGRERRYCKECGGSGICEHGRERRYCKQVRWGLTLRARSCAL